MKELALPITLILCSLFSACDVQSGITKKSVEKYAPTPTPQKTVEVVEQIDPADIVNVDTALEGQNLLVNRAEDKTTVDCNKYNPVQINDDGLEVTIKGACKRLTINGDRNVIVAAGLTEIILNGSGNSIQYSKYANGKKPLIKDNGSDNTISKGLSEDTQKK